MKIKFIILILILSFCTNEDSASEVIQVTDIQIKELTNLESNKEPFQNENPSCPKGLQGPN